jgi:DNA-directed RNA polymerase subunit alpha
VLVEYNQIIAGFNRNTVDVTAGAQTIDTGSSPSMNDNAIPQQIMDMPVDALELSTRTHNCLRRADIATIGQILQMDEKQLKAVRNLGDKSLEEIKDRVREKCLRFGYDPGGKWSTVDSTEGEPQPVDIVEGE